MALHLRSTGIDFTDFGDATETSELLDDYEEGTFTATPADASGNTSASTITGYYTKIGRVVTIVVGRSNVSTSGLTSTDIFQLNGIPFASSPMVTGNEGWVGVAATARLPYPAITGPPNYVTTPYVVKDNSIVKFWNSQRDSYFDDVLVSQLNSGGSDYMISITYMTE